MLSHETVSLLDFNLSGAFVYRLIIMQEAFLKNVRMKKVVFSWIFEFCLHKIQTKRITRTQPTIHTMVSSTCDNLSLVSSMNGDQYLLYVAKIRMIKTLKNNKNSPAPNHSVRYRRILL